MTVTFNVNATLFARVANAQSSEQTRFYLGGVSIEPAPHGLPGVTLTATDGNLLVSAYDAKGEVSEPCIVKAPPHVLKSCKPWRDGYEPALIGRDDTISVQDTKGDEAIAKGCLIDGSFPDWKRVIPGEIGVATGAMFDAAFMATVAKAMIQNAKSGLIIRGVDANSPHLVWGDDERMIGVLMPIRHERDAGLDIPQWAQFHAPAANSAAA